MVLGLNNMIAGPTICLDRRTKGRIRHKYKRHIPESANFYLLFLKNQGFP